MQRYLAAAAEVMTNWFGDHLTFTDTSSLEFGIQSRPIVSFRQAAKEAALSRLIRWNTLPARQR